MQLITQETEDQREDALAPEAPFDALVKTETPKPVRVGEIVEGPIVARRTAAVFVDLGPRGIGIIYGREFFLAHDALKRHGIGEAVRAKVVDPENDDGYVELSMSEAGRELAWEELRRTHETKTTIPATIEAANRGGLVATVEGVKAFLPVSQLSPEHYPHVEGGDKEKILAALRAFIGQALQVKILNIDPSADKLILSERAVAEEALREELKHFHVGDAIEGTVSGIVDFGLFIRFGPDEKLEGLIHLSELSWGAVDDIRKRYELRQRVKAKIIDIQGDRVSLSLKALLPNPWISASERFPAETEVAGTVVQHAASGAIVELAPDIRGIARADATELQSLPVGTTRRFRILSCNPDARHIELTAIESAASTQKEKEPTRNAIAPPEEGEEKPKEPTEDATPQEATPQNTEPSPSEPQESETANA